ncbi:MAG TPA: trehalose-phosphatase [Stellaceae bacterium]|jgi:trehalose 6-phosphate phosphatase|nr:trehalose-phosphatase [Stellaceae bacterium]
MPTQRMPENLNPGTIGLFLDVDGTLLDIAPRPEAVEVKASLLDDLAAVELTLAGAVALVSGRPVAELDRLFAPLRLASSGVHGAELRRRPDGSVTRLAAGRLTDDAWSALGRLLDEFPGSYAENKEVSFAVHYPAPGTDVDRLHEALRAFMARNASPGEPLQLIAGHAVFEVQLRGFDKGRAIRRFMKEPPFLGRQPVFIGDDVIDRAGFNTALRLGGLAYSVGIELPGLSGRFSGPDAVRAWLHGLRR